MFASIDACLTGGDATNMTSLTHAGYDSRAPRECQRGHELLPQNAVRHRDGRIAYCRLYRNERWRERYRTDRTFAEREIARQRQFRTRSRRRD